MPGDEQNSCIRDANAYLREASAALAAWTEGAMSQKLREAVQDKQRIERFLRDMVPHMPRETQDEIRKQLRDILDQYSTVISLDVVALPDDGTEGVTDWIANVGGGGVRRGLATQHFAARAYAVSQGGNVDRDGLSLPFQLRGEMTLVDRGLVDGLEQLEVQRLSLRLSTLLGGATFRTDPKWGPSLARLGPSGIGSLSLLLRVDYDDPTVGVLYPGMVALTLPIRREGESLRIITALGGDPLYKLAPVSDYPVSDYNRDGVLSQADEELFLHDWAAGQGVLTDLNGDGVRNLEDVDIFDTCFQHDLTRPR